MEKGGKKWGFEGSKSLDNSQPITVRAVLTKLREKHLNQRDKRPVIIFGHGDPTAYPCFRPASSAVDAVSDALRSSNFNCYSPAVGILPSRSAVADYLNRDLPYKLTVDDVFLTIGCTQAIEITIKVLARPGANILLPRPGYPDYEVHCTNAHLEIRYFDLLPERGWEFDLDHVESLADTNTVAMVVINPGNPCGHGYGYEFLEKVAETAGKLGVMVIADEVYGHFAFGRTEYVPQWEFSRPPCLFLHLGQFQRDGLSLVGESAGLLSPILTGSLHPLGNDNNFWWPQIVEKLKGFVYTTSDPATFVQGAIPTILESTKDDFFRRIKDMLRQDADIFYERIHGISCLTCPNKPEGAMSTMVKLNLPELDGIEDDMDFCIKLTEEESTVVLPGVTVGMKNWLRITFAVEPTVLEDGLARVKAFCERHAKK